MERGCNLTNIRLEMGYNSTIESTNIQRIGKYFQQIYANKFQNLDEMDKFPKRHKYLYLIQDKIDNLSSLKTITEIKVMVKKLPTKAI